MKCLHVFVGLGLLLSLSSSYKLLCPDAYQWTMRARQLCPYPSNYSCLFEGGAKIIIENCTWYEREQKGRRAIFCTGYTSVNCSIDRYQPFVYWTNVSTDCIYKKSLCNEEGQVIYDDSDPVQDTKCTCNHTRGFDFVTRPSNQCYCVPSEEDCSCYLKHCKMSSTQAKNPPKNLECNEEGQVIYDDSDPDQDTKCTCNDTRGYDFVIRPSNPCYCVPSQEDCSCNLKDCKMSNTQASNRCSETANFTLQNLCVPFNNSIRCSTTTNFTSQNDTNMNNSKEDPGKFDGQKEQVKTILSSRRDNLNNLATCVLICMIVMIGLCGIVWWCRSQIDNKCNYHVLKVYVIRPLSSESCYEGDPCNLKCEISKPNRLYWYKDNSILVEGNNVKTSCDGCVHTLTIHYMSKENDGTYELRSSFEKTLSRASVQFRPVFVASIDSQTCIEGDPISFICEVAEDDMEVKWFKGDETEYKDAILTGSDRLQISNTKLSDTGFYWIKTKNVTRKGKLTVKAYIKTHLKENIVMVIGTKDHLTCETEKTGIKATWYKDGKEITASDNITINESDGVYRLNIRNVSLQNKGQYKIIIDKHSSECCVDVKDIHEYVDVNV